MPGMFPVLLLIVGAIFKKIVDHVAKNETEKLTYHHIQNHFIFNNKT
jgi:hypothetical protein